MTIAMRTIADHGQNTKLLAVFLDAARPFWQQFSQTNKVWFMRDGSRVQISGDKATALPPLDAKLPNWVTR